MRGSVGVTLYERQGTVRAGDRTFFDDFSDHHRETFCRRLAEAQAFGDASEGLSRQRPKYSARGGLKITQRLTGWVVVFAFVGGLFVSPKLTLAIVNALLASVFAVLIAQRFFAAATKIGLGGARGALTPVQNGLPVITQLILLHREAEVLADLVRAIGALDYPPELLDVKLLVEADDRETLDAIERLGVHHTFEVIPVPPGRPRTKPKALNYGLRFGRGDLVAIFDAEDRPHPGQPHAAVAAFRRSRRRAGWGW